MGAGLGASAGAANAATATPVASQLTAPAGTVWMGTHAWVADDLMGMCRIDGTTVNQTVCATGPGAAGQPAFDPARNLLYVPDKSAQNSGLWRFSFDPVTERVGAGTLIPVAPDTTLSRPTATALSADGTAILVGFTRGAGIVRVSDPGGTPSAPSVIATTSDGGGALGLAMAGPDLYVAETAAVTKVPNAQTATGALAFPTAMQVSAPTAIVAKGADTLFVADTPTTNSAVLRYTVSTDTQDVYATSTTTGTAFSTVSGLGLNGDGSVLHVGDDPTAGVQAARGRLYGVDLAQPPAVAGAPGAPATVPVTPVGTGGTLVTSGATAPGGSVLLGSRLWVSDHLLGFCRVDPDPTAPEGSSINQDTCVADAAGAPLIASPGQPAYDKATNTVYVPDNARQSEGVWRLKFDPAADAGAGNFTATGRTVLAAGAGLGAKSPTALSLGPDGKLYVGYLRVDVVERIVDPLGATPTVEGVSSTSGGVSGIGFAGADLYLAEAAAVSMVPGAASCSGGCVPTATLIGATGPTALVANNADAVYVADTPTSATSIIEFIPSTGTQRVFSNYGTVPAGPQGYRFGSGLSLDESGNLYVGDDPGAGIGAGISFQGRVWKVVGAAPMFPPAVPPATPGTPDLAAASDSGSSDADDITNVTRPTITGTAPAGTTVSLFVDGATTAAASGTVSSTGGYSLVLPALSAATHTVRAAATNAGGGSSPLSPALSITVDTTAPAAPVITGGPAGTTTDTTPTFSFTAEAGATSSCSVGLTTAADSFAACASPATFGPLAGGSYRFAVRATDVAGNVGGAATRAFTVSTAPRDTIAPRVIRKTPVAGATSVALGVNVTATFSENVVAASVNRTTFTLTPQGGAPVAAVVTYNATTRVATLNPSVNLLADRTYTATLTSGVRDAAGNALAVTTWTFTTGPAPRVTGRSPAPNALGVSRLANVTATFSENVVGISGATFILQNTATRARISAVVTPGATTATRTATLNPSITLAPNTKYTVTLTTGIKDAAGNPLRLAPWSFTTGA